MPVLFNYDSVDATPMGDGVSRQALITPERVNNDCLLLDRWSLDASASTKIQVDATDLAWFQLLEGEATLDGAEGQHKLTTSHVVFLPPGFSGSLSTAGGTVVLYAGVPNADRFDPSNHHHEGAEHFQYILSGSGTVFLSEEPHPIRAGDTLYNYEFERHNFINDGDEDMVFVEYFVPAECTTVWTNPELVCAWLPTGKNVDGGESSRDIAAHSSAETVNPQGV